MKQKLGCKDTQDSDLYCGSSVWGAILGLKSAIREDSRVTRTRLSPRHEASQLVRQVRSLSERGATKAMVEGMKRGAKGGEDGWLTASLPVVARLLKY